MSRDWEAQFRDWAKPPGTTEQQRCQNAESAIRNAIQASEKLNNRDITVFTQGSYRNNTNVRKESDVDVGVICMDTFFFELPEGRTKESYFISDATYQYNQYKHEIQEALESYFGKSAVARGNKAFDIHETTYHVEADVAAFFEHRRYNNLGTYISGVELRTDKEDRRVINWPEQHYQNGVDKNEQTGRRYKSLVRVLKSLSLEMVEKGTKSGNLPGFLIECLVWNVPNDCFQHETYKEDLQSALAHLYDRTQKDETCKEWGEVSELLYLFHSSQKWNRDQTNKFIFDAWNYAELGN